ncbi:MULTISPECIES: sensor histidine kinase [unclassified Methylophaga]|jgi:signal transduction histidine kinase|nr:MULTISPECIES: sensor histidine kinase [unclassified Methylophaga]MAK66236.1 two-component sensor histidine kinase [Methylophaga sp.]MAY17431.1 two-component sensor histidine kinase [Methylophaga sp.]MBN47373.1 two-component sensor histidine kinase [Methylophaga sp.]HAO25334.1 two-component sensor histidine kinase [Methylophaga sp.]HCD03923.1 two-component sensor histidine kinase [Methylophaga sp.]|tara:strand:+ start:9949 stop:10917 length:969 start_codon:yes stop_codon:yes gene_type:complete
MISTKLSLNDKKNRGKIDLAIIVVASLLTYLVAGYFDLAERWINWAALGEFYQLDEIIFVLLVFSSGLMWFGRRRYIELQETLKRNLEIKTKLELQNADNAKLLLQNRALIKHITQVREAERNHLASELHDVFGQYLAAIDVNASVAIKYKTDDPKLQSILKTIQDSASYLRNVTRSQLRSLKPPGLETVGLSAAIEDLISQWQMSFPQYEININIEVDDRLVDYDTALTVYRCLQEALTNITRHAEAHKICIDLVTQNKSVQGNDISLTIRDDGKGFDPNEAMGKGLGLIGIRERVHALNGLFKLHQAEPTGSVLTLNIPL